MHVRQCRLFKHSLRSYRQLNGFYPSAEQGIEALVTRPTSSPIPEHWVQLVFHDTPMDSRGRLVVYRSPAPNGSDPYELFSAPQMAWVAMTIFVRNVNRYD